VPDRPFDAEFIRNLTLLTLSYAAVGYFQYLFFYWIHYYFKTVLQVGTEQSRFYAGLPNLALAGGMVFGGWLADRAQRGVPGRWGRVLVPAVGMFFGTAFLLFGVAAREPLWVLGCFTLSMAAVGTSESSFWQTAVELGRERGGTAAAVMNTGGNGIGLLAPLLTPAVSERLGWQWGIMLGGFVCFLGALCWCRIDPRPPGAHSRSFQDSSHEPN
jgi:MFS family permease